ncbi:MAG: glycosyltransferase family 8 protein [Candidatus Atribacteria bacterium]|nr:glycosyltransferase family 8 protein [Candidatus Atribacteria bacterium]
MNENDEKINIVAVTDDNYAQHLGVMLYSLLENFRMNAHRNLDIYIIEDSISKSNKINLKRIIEQSGANAIFKTIDNSKYEGFKVLGNHVLACYYRISIPEILTDSIKKAIYLDCDLIVKEDISKLWNIDISEYFLAAVEDLNYRLPDMLGLPAGSKYFNSGVLLLNLERWRDHCISDKAREWIKNNPDKVNYVDQDGLNAILFNRWKELSLSWNVQSSMFIRRLYELRCTKAEYMEARKNPSILHFTTYPKPWHFTNNHPLKKEYYKYLKKTPWKHYSPPDRNFPNFFKKIYYYSNIKRIALKVLPEGVIKIIRKLKNTVKKRVNL